MKKKMTVLAGLVLVAVLSLGSVAGTYAKYTTSDSASDEARVAAWGIDLAGTFADDINLFKTAYNNNVVSSNGEKVIAPGTSGFFGFNLSKANKAPEVNYTLSLVASLTTEDGTILSSDGITNIKLEDHLKFYLDDDGTYSTTPLTLAQLNAALNDLYTTDKVYAANTLPAGVTQTHYIDWVWDFESATDSFYDADDTDFGNVDFDDLAKIKFNIAITAQQTQADAN